MSELLRFLREQAEVGERESTGTFRVEPERALSLLARFQFPGEDGVWLALVRAAVSARAKRLEFFSERFLARARVIGLELTAEQLEFLFPHCLAARGQDPCRQVGLAVCNALRPGVASVHLASGARRVEFRSGEPPRVEAGPGVGSELVLEVRYRRTLAGLFRSRGRLQRSLLEERCAFSPVPIRFQGESLERETGPIADLVYRFLAADGSRLEERLRGGLRSEDLPSPTTYSFALLFGTLRPRLRCLVAGVEYSRPLPWLMGGQVVVANPELSLDLSHHQVVENPAFHSMIKQMATAYYQVLEAINEQRGDLQGAVLKSNLEELVGHYCRSGQLDRAEDLCRWLRELWDRDSLGPDLDHGHFLYRYSLVARRSGQLADKLLARAQSIYDAVGRYSKQSRFSLSSGRLGGRPLEVDLPQLIKLRKLEIEESTMGPQDSALQERLSITGADALQNGNYALAELCYRWLVDLANQAPSEFATMRVFRLTRLGQSQLPRSPQEARATLRQALAFYLEADCEVPRELISILDLLSQAEADLGNPGESLELERRALEVRTQLYAATPDRLLPTLRDLALRLRHHGKAREATDLEERIAEILKETSPS